MVDKKEKLRKILALGYVYFILFLMYLPIFLLIIFSFINTPVVGFIRPSDRFSFELYGRLFRNAQAMNALKNTLVIAVTSAGISTVLGTLGAVGVYYMKPKSKKVTETLTQLPVINAEIVMALSLAILFLVFGISSGFFTLLVGHVTLTVAFVYLNVKPKLVQMDPSVYEAALDLGATPRQALWKVIFPEILPGIISGFLLAFTLSLDDFVITIFLKAPVYDTLSTYVENQLRIGVDPSIRALTTLIFIFALLVLVYNSVRTKNEEKRKSHRLNK